MQRISKEFVGRTLRAIMFIVLVILICTAKAGIGNYLASI